MKKLILFLFFGSNLCLGQSISAPAPLSIEANATNVDAGNFVITWTNTTDNILVSLSLDFHVGATITFPTTTGLTLNTGYTSWNGVTSIVFYGNQTNVNNALAAMTISMGSIKTAVKISLEATAYDANYQYNPVNKHFYRYISGSINYATAKTNAANVSFKGKTGYVVTITSENENNFINNNISGNNIWVALTDVTTEGTWIIDSGPENGTIIKTANGQLTGNIDGQYNNWCSGEPNNSSGIEDYAVTKWNGGTCWNDVTGTATVGGYIVEISDDFPAGSGYTGVFSSYTVHNNDLAYTLASTNNTTISSSNVSNLPNIFGGLQINNGNTITIGTSSTFNTNKIIFSGTGKLVLTDNSSKWTPDSPNLINTYIHSPTTNSNPTYWAVSSIWAGDPFSSSTASHFTPYLNSQQAWSSLNNTVGENIKLSLEVPRYIAGIVSQARANNSNQWVKSAKIESSLDNANWTTVIANATLNTNNTDAVNVFFPTVVYAQYIRISPTDWSNHMSMRLGLIIKSSNIITDGLLLHLDAGNLTSYKGTGTSWTDLSDKGNHGTLANSPTYAITESGTFTFNGSTTQVSVADNASLETGSTNDLTMEVWMYPSSISGSQVILGKFNNGGSANDVSNSIRSNAATVYAQIGNGAGTYINSPTYTYTANKWYHVIFVFKRGSTKTLETFVNGKSIGSTTHTLSSILNSTNNLFIGRYNGGEFAQNYSGKIGIVRLYNRALSTTEIITNFNANRGRYGL
jgi:hypothetical protein